MTYVTEQTSQEIRAHMRRLKAMNGWHEPLADRLYKEILELDALLKAKVEQPVQPKRPTNCGTNFCSCIECLFDPPLVQPTKYGAA